MLIKFDADPNVDATSESSGSDDSSQSEEKSVSEVSDESPPSPPHKSEPERSKTPQLLLPFYEDYHMVHESDGESDGSRTSTRGKRSPSASESDNDNDNEVKRASKTRLADADLVKGVLELINAAKSASPGAAPTPSEKAPRVKASKKNDRRGEKKKATSKVGGDGKGGRYTVLKAPLPAKTKKSLETIARQLQVLQGKIDELAKHT